MNSIKKGRWTRKYYDWWW